MDMSKLQFSPKPYLRAGALIIYTFLVVACSGSGGDGGSTTTAENAVTSDDPVVNAIDITNAIFTRDSADCADYVNAYASSVVDITRSLGFAGTVTLGSAATSCSLSSNNIPNHDFNDLTARFATAVSEVNRSFVLPRNPTLAANATPLAQQTWDAVMLNGVVLDLLSAGCYSPNSPNADADGNVAIGCNVQDDWLLDPLGTEGGFGVDEHNAHTQPDGTYHYHGNPLAMFDDNFGPDGSPVIGFASDGFPIFGSYFLDQASGFLRKAISGYQLRAGNRVSSATDPGGAYDGTYIDDYEFVAGGDLDECNGMTVNGQYGYYVTDTYPWVLGCHSGTVDASFSKNQ
jgi:hypothetical protein